MLFEKELKKDSSSSSADEDNKICSLRNDLDSTDNLQPDFSTPLLYERQGDVISAHRALLALAKGFVGTGCLSLPYAWKEGGLWMSFSFQLIIAALNSYSCFILSKSSQYLAAKSERSSLNYGQFAKKVFDYSDAPILQRHSHVAMYFVNVTLLLYQLGISSVSIVFVTNNLNNILQHNFNFTTTNTVYATILLPPLIAVNMIATMRMMSYLAGTATVLWLFGTTVMLQQCVRMPNQWKGLPSYTTFWSTVLFLGTAMYSYKGLTLILPIENKLQFPEEFLNNCGVLPTLMVFVAILDLALGFFGYTAYGAQTQGTMSLNMPDTPLFTVVVVTLIIMAFLTHPVNLYVVFEMLWADFKKKISNRFPFWFARPTLLSVLFRIFWVFITYLIVITVQKIEQIVSLVGITGVSLCAFVYAPVLEMLTFWKLWQAQKSRTFICFKITINCFLIVSGIFMLAVGLYINVAKLYRK